jgi:hypothetical protein
VHYIQSDFGVKGNIFGGGGIGHCFQGCGVAVVKSEGIFGGVGIGVGKNAPAPTPTSIQNLN